ncbi:hypothetical protein D6C98_07480 [Aureobasidium pullulans]|nr:hypothetical protein D6C98_07480 [Aureobasidium pullulans]
MEALTATVKQLTEILAQVGASLAAATQKLEQTTKSLLSSEESLTSTKESLASTGEELASTKEKFASANQSLASTKEKLEQTASALTQSHMNTIDVLNAQIEARNEDLEMARKAMAESEWDQKMLKNNLQLDDDSGLPGKWRLYLNESSERICWDMAETMDPISQCVTRWEEQNMEATGEIQKLELQQGT